MKKFFAIAAAILISVASFAQETNIDKDGNYVYGPYETNAFTDNVFVGGGLGFNSIWNFNNSVGQNAGDGSVPFVTKPGLAIEGYVGKWFTPGVGARVGYYGITQELIRKGQHILAADFLWNFSNSVYGYNETRKWSFVPYARAGVAFLPFHGMDREWILGLGAMVTKQINEKWDFVIDVPVYAIGSDHVFIDYYNRWGSISFPFAVTFGAAYKIGKTNWTRTATTAAAAAAAIAAANAKAASETAAAKKATEDAQKVAETAKEEAKQIADEAVKAAGVNVDELFNEPVVVYFEIGQSKLSKTEKAHAEYAIKNIIARGNNVKFTLNGSADTGTGSKARNKQLSKQRAQTVYNLVDELGVSRENITVVEWDGTERFATPELNRAVIIEKQ